MVWLNIFKTFLNFGRVIFIYFAFRFFLPSGILHTIYKTLIMPHYSYCLLTWGSKNHIGHRLLLLQKKALRMIDGSHYIAHTEPICKKLQIVKISDLFRITVWKFYYKLTNTLLPSYFNQMMPTLPILSKQLGSETEAKFSRLQDVVPNIRRTVPICFHFFRYNFGTRNIEASLFQRSAFNLVRLILVKSV